MATFSGPVTASGDDGLITTTAYTSIGTVINWGSQSGVKRDVWMRFTNVTVPQGSAISAADVYYHVSQSLSGTTCNATIYCNDEDSATNPTDRADYEAKSVTTASVAWNGIAAQVFNNHYNTPDISGPVQEVVDRGGWTSGNAMMVLIKNNGSSSNAYRGCASYDNGSYDDPYLNITYTVPAKSPPPSTQSTKRPYQYLLSM